MIYESIKNHTVSDFHILVRENHNNHILHFANEHKFFFPFVQNIKFCLSEFYKNHGLF